MSSQLNKFLEMKQQMEALEAEMKRLQDSDALKKELEFKEMLETLMREYEVSADYVINLLDPAASETKQEATRTRRRRKLKVYNNPHTGEVVETRGGNHKVLKAWKEEYGAEEVESWLVDEAA